MNLINKTIKNLLSNLKIYFKKDKKENFEEIRKINLDLYNTLTDLEKLNLEQGVSGSGRFSEWPVLVSALKKMGFDFDSRTQMYPTILTTCRQLMNILDLEDRSSKLDSYRYLAIKKVAIAFSEEDCWSDVETTYGKEDLVLYLYYENLEEYQEIPYITSWPERVTSEQIRNYGFDITHS